jgi:16S rRNA processing protein RimM
LSPSTNPRPTNPEPREGFIAVGYVRGPHGLDGELKVESLSDNPERFTIGAAFRAGDGSVTIRSLRSHRGALLIGFEGVGTREQADELRGLLLEVPETELVPLEEGQYYRFQLIGLEVRDGEGNVLGRLEEVLDTGANDVYIVRNDESELLVPAIEPAIERVDLSKGVMTVRLIPGLEERPLRRKPRLP